VALGQADIVGQNDGRESDENNAGNQEARHGT
jgi:hypothetical protein